MHGHHAVEPLHEKTPASNLLLIRMLSILHSFLPQMDCFYQGWVAAVATPMGVHAVQLSYNYAERGLTRQAKLGIPLCVLLTLRTLTDKPKVDAPFAPLDGMDPPCRGFTRSGLHGRRVGANPCRKALDT
jgi:hypothetical protein